MQTVLKAQSCGKTDQCMVLVDRPLLAAAPGHHAGLLRDPLPSSFFRHAPDEIAAMNAVEGWGQHQRVQAARGRR